MDIAPKENLSVLVSGINYTPNQFTRAVEKYGVKAIHKEGDPDQNFPRNCDAAIVISSYTSHQRYWNIKSAYKAMNRPLWVVGNGFSEIREKFEEFLVKKRGYAMPPEATVPVGTLNVPATWVPVTDRDISVPPEGPVNDGISTIRPRYTLNYRKAIFAYASELFGKGMKAREIATHLNSKGWKRPGGQKFEDIHLSNIKAEIEGRRTPPPTAELKKRGRPVKSFTKPALAVSDLAVDPMTLIQGVMTSALTMEEKLRVVQRISSGEVRSQVSREAVFSGDHLLLEKSDIFASQTEAVSVSLTKAQSELVLESLADIHNFLTKGEL